MSYKTVKAIIEVDAALEHELRRHLRDFRAKHPNYGYVLWVIGPPVQPDHPALDPAREARARAITIRRRARGSFLAASPKGWSYHRQAC
jgi:hypothetical protein